MPRLKSRKSFIKCTEPINTTAKAVRLRVMDGENDSSPWTPVCTLTPVPTNTSQLVQRTPGQLEGTEPVAYTGWPVKSEHVKLGIHIYSNETETCDCGIRQTMPHLLVCPMINTACSTQNLSMANGIVIGCARHWEGTIRLKCDWWKDKNDDERDKSSGAM